MEEIKMITEEIEKEASKNVKNFDLTKLCYKSIFDLINNSGAFAKAFSTVTTYSIKDKSQIELFSFNYGYVKEKDERVYPSVDMLIKLNDADNNFQSYFCFTVTPFSAKLDNLTKDAGVYGGCDAELTKIWKKIMKSFFKAKWVEAYNQYCDDMYVLEECAIRTEAENKLLKLKEKYEENINSI